jgi:hypothetical protein
VRVSDLYMFRTGVDVIVPTWARSASGDKARHERVSKFSQGWYEQTCPSYNG